MTPAMCTSARERDYVFFVEFLPRIGAYQISFTARESFRLSVSARGVVWARLPHSEAAGGEEICRWPPHLPDLDPGSFLDGRKQNCAETGHLQLRFKSLSPAPHVWPKFEKLLDPPDLPPDLPPSTSVVVQCGLCGNLLTQQN